MDAERGGVCTCTYMWHVCDAAAAVMHAIARRTCVSDVIAGSDESRGGIEAVCVCACRRCSPSCANSQVCSQFTCSFPLVSFDVTERDKKERDVATAALTCVVRMTVASMIAAH